MLAGELKYKLGSECPKMVRMYGSAIEAKDYPVPRGDLRSTRGMRDLKCDPDLQVGLHQRQVIRWINGWVWCRLMERGWGGWLAGRVDGWMG